MKVLNFGSLNIDLIYRVPHIVLPGETISAKSLEESAGGKGANQSVALSKAGVEVWHAGTIGNDGKWLKTLLEKYGVHTNFVKEYDGPTGQAIIQVADDGQNSIFLLGGGNQNITQKQIDETLENFSEGDYLVLQNEINLNFHLIEKAHQKGMRICLNPAPFTKEVTTWPLEKLDLIVVNETEARGLAEKDGSYEEILDRLMKKYPSTGVLLTAGEDGAYFGKDRKTEYTAAVKVEALDTTAAGDTFLGFFLASQIKGFDIQRSLNVAAKAAGLTVSRPGAMDSIPEFSELQL